MVANTIIVETDKEKLYFHIRPSLAFYLGRDAFKKKEKPITGTREEYLDYILRVANAIKVQMDNGASNLSLMEEVNGLISCLERGVRKLVASCQQDIIDD